jgi:WD40 repeat protein
VALNPDNSQLLTCAADYTIKRFDLASGNELAALPVSEHLNPYETATFSPTGQWLAACDGSRNLVVRDTTQQAEAIPLESQVNAVKAVAFSPDGRWFVTGNNDTSLTLWETVSGRVVAVPFGNAGSINALAFNPNPDSSILATGSLGDEIKLWDVSTTSIVKSWPAGSDGVYSLVFTPDGKRLFSAGRGGAIKCWDVATGRELNRFNGHQNDVNALALSKDGKWLVSASADQTVRLWNAASGKQERTFQQSGPLFAVAFNSNNQFVAAGATPIIKVWDAATGNEVRSFNNSINNQRTPTIYSLAFSPDGSVLAAGGDNNEIRLWESATAQPRTTLLGHASVVNALQFNSDGQWLASGGEDGSARFWQTATGVLAVTIAGLRGGNEWIVATPDGLFDGSPNSWRQILWRFARDTFNFAPVELFFNEYFYPELLADVLAGKKPPAKEQIALRDRRQPSVKLSVSESAGVTTSIATSRTAKIRLEVAEAAPDKQHAQGSGAQDVRLFRNGALVKVWHGDVLKGQTKTALECDVTLVAGENRLTAYAFNRENIKSTDAERRLVGATSLQRRGTAYVLAVGLNQYSNPSFNLKFAVDDAKGFSAEWLKQQTALNRFARIETVLLLDQQATKANLSAALKRLAGNTTGALPAGAPPDLQRWQRVQPEDAVIVYFAGHGVASEARFYLLPFELGYKGKREQLTPEIAKQQVFPLAISDQELETLFEPLDVGHLLLVIDACNSGGVLESEENRRGPMNTKGLAQLAYEKGMHVLAASQTYQVAQETSTLGHGYLTYALIEDGLKKMAADQRPRDGQVWLREWFDYATQAVPQMQEAKVTGQRLLLKHKLQKLREVQRPRVFYRRELETQQLVVGKR